MYRNSKYKSFWIYDNYNRIELHPQQKASGFTNLICKCQNYQSALRIGKEIAEKRNISFQEILSYG